MRESDLVAVNTSAHKKSVSIFAFFSDTREISHQNTINNNGVGGVEKPKLCFLFFFLVIGCSPARKIRCKKSLSYAFAKTYICVHVRIDNMIFVFG